MEKLILVHEYFIESYYRAERHIAFLAPSKEEAQELVSREVKSYLRALEKKTWDYTNFNLYGKSVNPSNLVDSENGKDFHPTWQVSTLDEWFLNQKKKKS